MKLFTIRNIISATIGLNIAGAPLFFSMQNFFNGEYVMGTFLFVVGICGLVLPEYLIRRLFEKPVKDSVVNTKNKVSDTSDKAFDQAKQISNDDDYAETVVESVKSKQSPTKDSLTNLSNSISDKFIEVKNDRGNGDEDGNTQAEAIDITEE